MEWMRPFGGDKDEEVSSVISVGDGYVVAGSSYSFIDGVKMVYLAKFHPQGRLLWERVFGSAYLWSSGCKVQRTLDGGLIIGASVLNVPLSERHFYLIKTDPRGVL